MRYISEILWRHSQDISGLFPNYSDFLVCLSVFQLAYLLTEIRLMQGYIQFQMRYLSEIFWRHSQDVSTLVQNNSEYLVFLSVGLLAYFLTEISQTQGYLQFWMRYLYETFWRHFWDVGTPVPNISEFLVGLLVFQLAYFLTYMRQI